MTLGQQGARLSQGREGPSCVRCLILSPRPHCTARGPHPIWYCGRSMMYYKRSTSCVRSAYTPSFRARDGHHRINNPCVRSANVVIPRKAWAPPSPHFVRTLGVRCHSAQGMGTIEPRICAYDWRTLSFRASHGHHQIHNSCVRSAYAVNPRKAWAPPSPQFARALDVRCHSAQSTGTTE